MVVVDYQKVIEGSLENLEKAVKQCQDVIPSIALNTGKIIEEAFGRKFITQDERNIFHSRAAQLAESFQVECSCGKK